MALKAVFWIRVLFSDPGLTFPPSPDPDRQKILDRIRKIRIGSGAMKKWQKIVSSSKQNCLIHYFKNYLTLSLSGQDPVKSNQRTSFRF